MKNILKTKYIGIQKIKYPVLSIVLLIFIASCCSTSGMVKRKYKDGYYTNLSFLNNKKHYTHKDELNEFLHLKSDTLRNEGKQTSVTIEQDLLVCKAQVIREDPKEKNNDLLPINFQEQSILKYSKISKQTCLKSFLSDTTLLNKEKVTKRQETKAKETEQNGITSFILGLISAISLCVFLIFSIKIKFLYIGIFIIGLIAYILGIISGYRIRKNREKYKGIFWGMMGGILGGFAFVLAAFILIFLFWPLSFSI